MAAAGQDLPPDVEAVASSVCWNESHEPLFLLALLDTFKPQLNFLLKRANSSPSLYVKAFAKQPGLKERLDEAQPVWAFPAFTGCNMV